MRRRLIPITVVVLFVATAGILWYARDPGYGLSRDEHSALRDGIDFTLTSLSPLPRMIGTEASGPELYGFEVLGELRITDRATREKIVRELKEGLADKQDMVASCFNPRHAISMDYDGLRYDFVICFECRGIRVYGRG